MEDEAVNTSSSSAQRDDGLPTSFDVLIVGTGLTESIVSAAFSRNGHTVLHIDPREYYGGTWATFSLDQWVASSHTDTPVEAKADVEVLIDGDKGQITWRNDIENFEQVWYNTNEETRKELMSQKRRFNIDVMPKLIAAREDIVELLIKSNVSRYLEFLRISKLLTNLPPPKSDVIESIPLSRADIFTSKSLTLVEKRCLVKLIEAVMHQKKSNSEDTETDNETVENKTNPETFEDLVKTIKVSEKISHLVKSSVTVLEDGLSNGETLNREFFDRCRLFLNSIGRYGNQTPFLWTLYGISEICQAFCRLSAVYGGIYILKRHLSKIESSPEGFLVKTEDNEIKVKHIVLGPEARCDLNGKNRSKKEEASVRIGRSVLVTTAGNITPPDDVTKSKGDGIFVYRISGLEIIEMNHTSQAVPKNYRLLQISFPIVDPEFGNSQCRKHVEELLAPFIDFSITSDIEEPVSPTDLPDTDLTGNNKDEKKPRVIYGSYFILNYSCRSLSSEVYKSSGDEDSKHCIMECDLASTELSCHVSKAQQIFSSLYPDEEFLPRAPDCDGQEDVVNGDTDDEISEGAVPTTSNENAAAAAINENNSSNSGNAETAAAAPVDDNGSS